MKKNLAILVAACALTAGTAVPSFAGTTADLAGTVGSTAALVIDIPEGMALDSLWRQPKRFSHAMADKLGDEHGLAEQVVGAMIGIPAGMVWGVPHGAIQGGRHALSSGWEKPFSTESFIVSEEK